MLLYTTGRINDHKNREGCNDVISGVKRESTYKEMAHNIRHITFSRNDQK